MRLAELKKAILELVNLYIGQAEEYEIKKKKHPNSLFYFLKSLGHPYQNKNVAEQLKTLCEKPDSEADKFITALNDICQPISLSGHLLPDITAKLIESDLYPALNKTFSTIKANIDFANDHNDGGGSSSITTADYKDSIQAQISANNKNVSLEMKILTH